MVFFLSCCCAPLRGAGDLRERCLTDQHRVSSGIPGSRLSEPNDGAVRLAAPGIGYDFASDRDKPGVTIFSGAGHLDYLRERHFHILVSFGVVRPLRGAGWLLRGVN